VVRQFDDRDPSRDRLRGVRLAHPDAGLHHPGAVRSGQGWTTRSVPSDPWGSTVARHQVAVHEVRHHQVDALAAAELGFQHDWRRAAAESCGHPRARRAVPKVRYREEVRVYQEQYLVGHPVSADAVWSGDS